MDGSEDFKFDFAFTSVLVQGQEIEIVRIFEDLLREVGLRLGQCSLEL
jgi:hypothetical protein